MMPTKGTPLELAAAAFEVIQRTAEKIKNTPELDVVFHEGRGLSEVVPLRRKDICYIIRYIDALSRAKVLVSVASDVAEKALRLEACEHEFDIDIDKTKEPS